MAPALALPQIDLTTSMVLLGLSDWQVFRLLGRFRVDGAVSYRWRRSRLGDNRLYRDERRTMSSPIWPPLSLSATTLQLGCQRWVVKGGELLNRMPLQACLNSSCPQILKACSIGNGLTPFNKWQPLFNDEPRCAMNAQ